MIGKMDVYLTKTEQMICAIGLFLVTILITINVILRYFFNADIAWSSEVVRYVIILVSFIGTSLCVREGMHISVDILKEKLKGRKKEIYELLINIVCLIFAVTIVILSFQLITQNIKFPQKSPALQIPMYIPYLSIFIGFMLSGIRYCQLIAGNITSMKMEVK